MSDFSGTRNTPQCASGYNADSKDLYGQQNQSQGCQLSQVPWTSGCVPTVVLILIVAIIVHAHGFALRDDTLLTLIIVSDTTVDKLRPVLVVFCVERQKVPFIDPNVEATFWMSVLFLKMLFDVVFVAEAVFEHMEKINLQRPLLGICHALG